MDAGDSDLDFQPKMKETRNYWLRSKRGMHLAFTVLGVTYSSSLSVTEPKMVGLSQKAESVFKEFPT